MKKTISILLGVIFTASIASAQITWNNDRAHSEVQFKVKHMVISTVTGEFRDYTINFTSKNADDFTDSKIETILNTASIFTNNERRDNDLRSDNFLNAEMYPELKFVSRSFKKSGEDTYKVVGDLTIRDVTKSVELTAEFGGSIMMRGTKRIAFHITGEIDRFDFNVKWNRALETGGLIVSKKVQFDFNLEFTQQEN